MWDDVGIAQGHMQRARLRKELTACAETLHDLFTLLGLDSSHNQDQGGETCGAAQPSSDQPSITNQPTNHPNVQTFMLGTFGSNENEEDRVVNLP